MSNATNDGVIRGIQLSPSAPILTHLLFADDSFLFFHANIDEALAVKALLNDYERMSGQSVNFEKSGVMFSNNVNQSQRTILSGILGVSNNLSGGKYLGLPSLVGRSKKRVFGFVKDKVWKLVQSWNAKPISRAGKAVLIKNVAQAVPSYCMSIFLLPKSLCHEIEVMLNKFWWNSNSSDRKGLNWHSWSAMSMLKSKGGMGFRSLYGFNLALLGKLS